MKRLLLWCISCYRRWISPIKPPCCRFYPTCSQYALEAVKLFGAARGSALAVWRILRCNPWNRGGLDPLPDQWIDALPFNKKRGKTADRKKLGSEEEKGNWD